MELALLVYLIGILDNVMLVWLVFTMSCAIVVVFMSIKIDTEYGPEEEIKWRSVRNKAAWIGALLTIFVALLPSEKTAWMMVGGYAAQKVYEKPTVQKLEQKVLDVIEKNLDGLIEEGVKKASKK